MMTEENKVTPEMPEEPELYEEPARMSVKDGAGVVIALVLLAVIAVAGYIWLTPNMSFSKLKPGGDKAESKMSADAQRAVALVSEDIAPAEPEQPMPEMTEPMPAEHDMDQAPPADAADQSASRIDPLAAPETHDHDMSCPYCGMNANASGSQVVVIWSNGNHEHYDSWDCLFSDGKEQGLEIVRAVVRLYEEMDEEPRWLKVQQAWYLYDTEKIPMSMPPYVAAFDTHDAAAAAQAELGGELVNFAGLSAHWE